MSTAWHNRPLPDIFEKLQSGERGLSNSEAEKRLAQDGFNALPEPQTDTYAKIFLRQFGSPLIYILLGASAIVYLLGEVVDAAIILAILIFNAVIGTLQEGRAQNTLSALKRFVETSATVERDGVEVTIPDREVVRGDILVIQEGEKIPADARLITASNLKVDEASLTGESEPVLKSHHAMVAEDAPPQEQLTMVFKGTNVFYGRAKAIAVAIGQDTLVGRIATEISSIDTEIPLKANIRYLSRAIIGIVALAGAVIFALGLAKGEDLVTIFATVVSIAVSAIPEGLPIVMTLVLATGVWRMSKRNALVKKLQAVEALGQARVIAVDKTGTITKNELVIREVYTEGRQFEIGGVGYEPKGEVKLDGSIVDAANHPELLFAGKIAAFCANARIVYSEKDARWRVSGDPTEAAMRVFGEKVGFAKDALLKESPFVTEIPFDSDLKYHATVHRIDGKNFLSVLGAPETILALCTHVRQGGENRSLREKDREKLEAMLVSMSERGLRIVASAIREQIPEGLAPENVHGLTFVCFLGMQDALRPEVATAMSQAARAGIKVVMITGDHRLTARAIAKEAGIWNEGDGVITGEEIDKLSDLQVADLLDTTTVFARVTPEHKLRLITAYKKRGEVVAMTGDGVNDAPPLVAADLGIAMGKIGTEVAKEAADIVLLDDNFGSIVSAIEEGRNIYRTIKRVMLYLFSTNLGEVFVITGALLLDFPLPILAAQIIWLNFVTDGFLDVALAMEKKDEGLLSGRFQRPNRYIIDSLMVQRMIVMALPMMAGTLILFAQFYETDLAKAWTISLTTLAVFQWFNAWNCRSETQSVFSMRFFSNPYLVAATGLVIALQLLAVYSPLLQSVLRTVPLSISEWLMILPVAASILVVEEVRKYFARRKVSEKTMPQLGAFAR